MRPNNFSRLIDEINKQQSETYHYGPQKTIRKSLPSPCKKGPTFKSTISSLHKAAISTGRSLDKIKYPSLSKSEERMINRMNMKNFRANLRKACMSKSITSAEVCRLETQVNNLSTALAQKGLI